MAKKSSTPSKGSSRKRGDSQSEPAAMDVEECTTTTTTTTTPTPRKNKRKSSESSSGDGTPNKSAKKSPPPAMDVVVHRMRHLEYVPHPIVCIRATPPSDTLDASYVALSREYGGVELKAPNEKFRTIAEIAGYRKKVVNTMAWTCGMDQGSKNSEAPPRDSKTTPYCRPTLVGGSRDGTLFIVNFNAGILTGMIASGGGGVCCLSSLCQHEAGSCCVDKNRNNCAQLVAAGCEDGTVRLFKIVQRKTQPTLELLSIIPSGSGAAVLSVAWRRTPEGSMVLFAGVSDGTIRRYDWEPDAAPSNSRNYTTGKGSWKSSLRMTVENLGRSTPTRVWALELLSDGTVISGDSLGHVQFWDGNTGTLLQSFDQNDSKADVLDIAVVSEETKVFASGVDSRVVCIERSTVEGATPQQEVDHKWVLSQVQRPHTHDVRAITVCRQQVHETDKFKKAPTESNGCRFVEMLCSGGIDTKLCTYYVDGFKKLRPKSLYPWPAFSPVTQANSARVLILRRETLIDLYRVEANQSEPLTNPVDVPDEETHLGTIEISSSCNLICASISDDGRYLAAADAGSLFVFRLAYIGSRKGTSMTPTKLKTKVKANGSFVAMKFGGNDQLYAAASDGSLHVIKMPSEEEGEQSCTEVMVVKQKQSKLRHKDSLFPVQSIVFSKDNKWFATLQGGLGCSHVRIFSYDDEGTKYFPWWQLPDIEAPVTAVRFLETGKTPELVASCSNFAFYHFDVMNRQLSKWSEDSGVPVSKHLPSELIGRNDYPIRIASNPASPDKILLGSFGAFALVDLSKKIPQSCRVVPEKSIRWKKKHAETPKKPGRPAKEPEAIICLRYNSILHMDFISANEMIIVEQPWLNVIATFPAPLERKIYGS